MKVELISYSKAADAFNHTFTNNSISDLVAHCARVSNPANQMNQSTNDPRRFAVLAACTVRCYGLPSLCGGYIIGHIDIALRCYN